MITRRLVLLLGTSQLVMWGVTYYQIAVFGPAIGAETGWSRTLVFGGFSVGLLTMAVVSGLVGRLVDERGGRVVMAAGSVLAALGCVVQAAAHDVATYYAAWVVLGVAMRMTLYDTAFAALARIAGPAARGPISQITLLGGLASTALWPIGSALAEALGWRGALLVYAVLALATLPLHLAIPSTRYAGANAGGPPRPAPLADTPARRRLAGLFYASLVTLASILNSAMSAHMIAILTGLGMATGFAVWTSSLRGVGQAGARLAEVLFGHQVDPFRLGFGSAAILPVGFALGLLAGGSPGAGVGFALIYGAGNGLLTIVRGTQPLLLFEPASYGRIVGRLIGPSFVLSALAPTAYAFVMDRGGPAAALHLSIGIAAVAVASALGLTRTVRPVRPVAPQ